jgi:tRNA wybutosine-synthesizing protein 3
MSSAESRFKMLKKHHTSTFEKAKKDGKMDLEFIPLCDFITTTKEFFTSSCCAGRIVLVGLDKKESKKESAFHRKWHRKVSFDEVKEGVEKYAGEVLWFKQEPFIFHVVASNLENAKKLLVASGNAGAKKSGINVAKEGKFLIEMLGAHNITLPIKENGKIMISDNALNYIVKKANQKFVKNQQALKKLAREIKKELKKK